ncbi:MAG: glycosyltransferase family 39 protein [Abditibacteriales bacterium]|nr:glycosyltransferase family 39 protein [Abditibacteriales bacterium]MDW8366494.1 glycosyltransferase family 39 protein [Abditibacteriales bacterium]
MTKFLSHRSHRWLIAVAVLAAIAVRLPYLWLSTEYLVSRMPDDAFYYFTITRHLARGQGSTFDGLNLTNGYHPLWAIVQTPVHWLTADPPTALRLILALATLISAVTVALLFLSVKALAGQRTAFLVAVVWALHPSMQHTDLSGMETVLYGAMLAATFCFCVTRCCPAPPPSAWVKLGVLLGFTALARWDSLFLAGLMGVWLLCQRQRPLRDRLQAVVRIGVPFALIVLPVLLWNKLTFGHFTPISGRVKLWYQQVGYLSQFDSLISLEYLRAATHTMFVTRPKMLLRDTVLSAWGRGKEPIIALTALALLMTVFLWRRNRSHDKHLREKLKCLDPYPAFAAFIYTYYTLCFHHMYSYYMLPITFCLWLMGAACIGSLLERWLSPRWSWGVVAVISLFTLQRAVSHHPLWRGAPLVRSVQWKVKRYRLALWLKQHTEPDAIIAAWNAGVFGYFSERRVINLDGLVNNDELLDALKSRRLGDYLREKRVDYVVDYFLRDHTRTRPHLTMHSENWYDVVEPIAAEALWANRRYLKLLRRVPFDENKRGRAFYVYKMVKR